MTAELSIYESFIEAGVQHYTGADSFALNGALVGYGVDYVQLGEEMCIRDSTDIPVVYSAVTDPAAAGFDGEENITGTSDALNTDAIMNPVSYTHLDVYKRQAAHWATVWPLCWTGPATM